MLPLEEALPRLAVSPMRIAHAPTQLERRPRAVAIGTFDGVHRGHLSVLEAAVDSGLDPTVITFDPHPRIALGNRVELITTLERRLELLAEAGIAETLVAAFTPEFMRLDAGEFVATYLTSIGVEAVAVGDDFRFGHRRVGHGRDARRRRARRCSTSRRSTASRRPRSATRCARATLAAPRGCSGGRSSSTGSSSPATSAAARSATRPRTSRSDPQLLARATASMRARRSATAPRSRSARTRTTAAPSGASSRYLLDFDGDLYGKRLVVELWERLRDEAVFESEEALVAQIAPRRRGDAGRRAARVSPGRRATNTGCDVSSSVGIAGYDASRRSRPRSRR